MLFSRLFVHGADAATDGVAARAELAVLDLLFHGADAAADGMAARAELRFGPFRRAMADGLNEKKVNAVPKLSQKGSGHAGGADAVEGGFERAGLRQPTV